MTHYISKFQVLLLLLSSKLIEYNLRDTSWYSVIDLWLWTHVTELNLTKTEYTLHVQHFLNNNKNQPIKNKKPELREISLLQSYTSHISKLVGILWHWAHMISCSVVTAFSFLALCWPFFATDLCYFSFLHCPTSFVASVTLAKPKLGL